MKCSMLYFKYYKPYPVAISRSAPSTIALEFSHHS